MLTPRKSPGGGNAERIKVRLVWWGGVTWRTTHFPAGKWGSAPLLQHLAERPDRVLYDGGWIAMVANAAIICPLSVHLWSSSYSLRKEHVSYSNS